jgi:hypothetical protein
MSEITEFDPDADDLRRDEFVRTFEPFPNGKIEHKSVYKRSDGMQYVVVTVSGMLDPNRKQRVRLKGGPLDGQTENVRHDRLFKWIDVEDGKMALYDSPCEIHCSVPTELVYRRTAKRA